MLDQTLFPLFLPDATYGVVRSLSSQDIHKVGIKALMVNTYHLFQKPGLELIKQANGIKKFMNWSGVVASDSGGFQLFSLINKNPDFGKVTDEGIVSYTGKKKQTKQVFTPEESIRVQFALGSDIMICLDDFTPPNANRKRIEESVERTVHWAERSKAEFTHLVQKNNFSEENRPLLIAPIQGHRNWKLREKCAQKLMEIEFDIYGLGGWPFDDQNNFDYEMVERNSKLTPDDKLRFGLGIGNPENISRLYQMGYDLFDCVLPTRDARHKRLYVFKQTPQEIDFCKDKDWYQYLYFERGSLANDYQPISKYCDCPTCKNHSRAYLHHLFQINDTTALRLASLHNLRFYAQLMESLKKNKFAN